MSRRSNILCTVLLFAPACDGVETSEDELLGPSADADEDPAPTAAQPDAEDVTDNGPIAAAGNCATLFEHIDYGGARLEVNVGAKRWIGGPWNDQVSSMKVRPGCVFNAYEHIDFGGAQKSFLGNVPWVGDGWNNKISSYICSC